MVELLSPVNKWNSWTARVAAGLLGCALSHSRGPKLTTLSGFLRPGSMLTLLSLSNVWMLFLKFWRGDIKNVSPQRRRPPVAISGTTHPSPPQLPDRD